LAGHGQSGICGDMPAYLIARVEVTDWARYREYMKATPGAIERFGGRFIVRGGETATLEGPEEKRRVVVIEFPSLERVKAFYGSEEYSRAKELRAGAATGQFMVLEGCAGTERSPAEGMGFLFGRRSIRVYAPREVSAEAIQKLLEAAMAAPSAGAKDPWRFVVIRNREVLARVAPELSNGEMLLTAGVGIMVCGDLEAAHGREVSFLLQDCAAAIENLLLCAHILGLGACWLGVHPREPRGQRIREILSLPASVIPVSCVAVGHPGESKEPRTRFNRDYVHAERW
jgi:uncharacterized protein (DUF1330 family)/nitroreductase